MKKMKPQSTQPCSYCKARADWKAGWPIKFACEEHKHVLQEHETNTRDDGHMSEADHQTWGRF